MQRPPGGGLPGAGVGLLEAPAGAAHHRQLQDPLQHILLLLAWKESSERNQPTSFSHLLGGGLRAAVPTRAGLGPDDLGGIRIEASAGLPRKRKSRWPRSPGHSPGSGEP